QPWKDASSNASPLTWTWLSQTGRSTPQNLSPTPCCPAHPVSPLPTRPPHTGILRSSHRLLRNLLEPFWHNSTALTHRTFPTPVSMYLRPRRSGKASVTILSWSKQNSTSRPSCYTDGALGYPMTGIGLHGQPLHTAKYTRLICCSAVKTLSGCWTGPPRISVILPEISNCTAPQSPTKHSTRRSNTMSSAAVRCGQNLRSTALNYSASRPSTMAYTPSQPRTQPIWQPLQRSSTRDEVVSGGRSV